MSQIEKPNIPNRLHIVTYDVRGTRLDTGEVKATRQTGIVTQTHQIMKGFGDVQPSLRLAVTQTGIKDGEASSYNIVTPEGQTVFIQGIESGFPKYLKNAKTGGKDKELVKKYYEDEIDDPSNPVYLSLAKQYARVIRGANTSHVLLQNPNPLVSLLKAEELGYLDDITLGQLNVTGVVHDVEEYRGRLAYVQRRLDHTQINLKFIAISQFVQQQLHELGVPDEDISRVPNGLDIQAFDETLTKVQENNLFNEVKERNNLPDGKMILVPSRRVKHKGHLDVIKAVKILEERGRLDGTYVAFTGAEMLNTQDLDFESEMQAAIAKDGLEEKVFLLDPLTHEEVNACYDGASISVLASTEPEGFAYANVEAMLAGVPVITTQIGGPLDYIQDGKTGLFVQPHDPEGIAQALDRLLSAPDLYERISLEGRKKAEEYTTTAAVSGYADAINAGQQRFPIKINPGTAFEKLGEGMYTEVYRHTRERNPFVVQVFRKEMSDLTIEKVQREYDYLCDAYKDMPGLIPVQRLLIPNGDAVLAETLLVKKEVKSDQAANNLRTVSSATVRPETLEQLAMFIKITKELFTKTSEDPQLADMGSLVPDIIDPELNNLVIDQEGNLRLVDTNMLINTKHLKSLVATGSKLDLEKKKIHGLLLRRLMYLDSKFFGKTKESLKQDSFYSQYLSHESFDLLFEQSKEAGEPIS